jgi:uncharacterized protein (DUF305 family)
VSIVSVGSLAVLLAWSRPATLYQRDNNQEHACHRRMDDAMTVMNQDIKRLPMTGDIDRDFAAMMIPHHQAAIEMAKAELLCGKTPRLTRIAQEIIITQQQEITVLKLALNN